MLSQIKPICWIYVLHNLQGHLSVSQFLILDLNVEKDVRRIQKRLTLLWLITERSIQFAILHGDSIVISCFSGALILKNATEVYYKMRQVFYYKMRQFYYKMQQLLQIAMILIKNATFITIATVQN